MWSEMTVSSAPRVLAVIMAIAFMAGVLSADRPATAGSRESDSEALATPQLIERAVRRGQIDRPTGYLYLAYALGAHRRLPAEYVSDVPWDGTVPLLRLRERVRRMGRSPQRQAIQQVLAASPGSCGGTSGTSSTSSTYFFIEYQTIQGGLSIADYAASLDTARSTEINSFGWAAPPLSTPAPPGGKYHVVVSNLASGLYGFVSTNGTYGQNVGNNPNTPWNEGDAWASCMALNRNYDPFPGTSQQALNATTAHEFNHSIQFGLGALTGANAPDSSFIEGGATWMEDEVFDSSNDNYNYLWPDFTDDMGSYAASPYRYWIILRGLAERYGTGVAGGGEQVMQDFWELTSQSATSNMLPAMNTALTNKPDTNNLADAFHAFAVAVRFNRSCGGGYVYPYCLEEGPSYVAAKGVPPVQETISSVGGSANGSVRDNYALNWASLPASGGPYHVTLQNTSGGGQLRASLACDTGSAVSVSPLPAVVGSGASTTLSGYSVPAGCSSVFAVITNQAQTSDNPSSSPARTFTLSTTAVSPPSNSSPVLAAIGNKTVAEGIQLTFTISATDSDGDTLDFSASNLPPGASFNFVTGTFSWTPTLAQAGVYPGVHFEVTDGMDVDFENIQITVTDVPSASSPPASSPPVLPSIEVTPGTKDVTLGAKPKRVESGERTRLKAVVFPCAGHEGDLVEFFRGSKQIAEKQSNDSCVAKLRTRVRKTAKYRAVSPMQDADHLAGTSNWVRVKAV
jgi:hypothetical protein